MNDYHYSFVRFRAIPPACVAKAEMEGGGTVTNPIFEAEPIRVLLPENSFDNMDMEIDGPTTIKLQHSKRGLETMPCFETTTHKRLRTTTSTKYRYWGGRDSCNHNDGQTSSQLHALSIDLIVSHIIGFLPWKQQLVSCSRVSKLWNQSSLTAPMRVLLFPRKKSSKNEQSNPLPRVLEPCHIERLFNEMSWKVFVKMQNTIIMDKITRLDIWGDLDWDQESKKHQKRQDLGNFGHLEELYLRYMSLDNLLDIFPESKHPRYLQLTKLVVKEWGSKNAQNTSTTKKDEEKRDLLRQRILFHAPNLLILKGSV